MTRTFRCLCVALFLVPAGAGATPAQDAAGRTKDLDRVLEALAATRFFTATALSPDGKSVAWVEAGRSRPDGQASDSTLHVAELGSSPVVPRQLNAGEGAREEHSPAWSPDGKWVAFLSDREKAGQPQLYVAPASGQEARKLTSLKGQLAEPRWSPDGKRIALLHTEGADRPTGPTQPAAPELGEVGTDVPAQRLTVLDVETGRARATSPAVLHVHEYDWSPDGRQLVAVASPAPGDSNWYVARLCTVAASTGDVHDILKPTMQIAVPRWSPDGRTIAFIGGLMSDEGVIGGDVYTVPVAGGEPRNHTTGRKTSPSWLAWLPTSRVLMLAEHVEGDWGISTLDLDGDTVKSLWTGSESIAALSLSRDGKISSLIRQSFQSPPEVWAGTVGGWQPVTKANRDLKPHWGEAQDLRWKSDSWEVQGWLLYPRDYDARKRYPLVVSVHGGPASARHPAWPRSFFDLAVLASQGYFVFFPNPRGSYGQGEAFTRANVKDFGHGDLRDILTGVDAVLKRVSSVDGHRLGIAGWSYGGYMTMWAVTQTNRFRTAVAGAGVANWQSYAGQNGIDEWLLPYFGATVYDDPAVYARSSPIEFIKRVRTPTLVLVGERDAECPAPQSREFWHALRTLGVPTRLVVYPGEGHGIAAPEHRRDVMRRTLGWLDRSLQASGTPKEASKEK